MRSVAASIEPRMLQIQRLFRLGCRILIRLCSASNWVEGSMSRGGTHLKPSLTSRRPTDVEHAIAISLDVGDYSVSPIWGRRGVTAHARLSPLLAFLRSAL